MSAADVRRLVDGALAFKLPVPPARIRWEWAGEQAAGEAPDELVEGVLVRGGLSVFFGESNSGKTFLLGDIAASIARGTDWMGRRTECGLVIYIAAESPSSIRTRSQAYQRHHECKLSNFVTVTSQIDLFSDEADCEELVSLVKSIESTNGKRAELVVCDTLARMSAGANENSGQDMGLVIRRLDALREATGAHVAVIHHSGKDAAKGARGWSGVRAAVDTEVEITADEATGLRCAEVTKQRDLPGKGERIGFRLEVVELGQTKWGKPFTSCVVVPADAPMKPKKNRRESEIAGAICEYLSDNQWRSRGEIASHFKERYADTNVYREIRKMVADGRLIESAKKVRLKGV